MSKPRLEVAVGVLLGAEGKVLLGSRPDDKPWPGWWELPGGKIEAGETVQQALARELKEELNITIGQARPWVVYTHEYPKTIVRLHFCRVYEWQDEPCGMENQQIAWVDPANPDTSGPLLPAALPPLRWLQLPEQYLITSIGEQEKLPIFLQQLERALRTGLRLVQFREPAWPTDEASQERLYEAFVQVRDLCHHYQARCLINSRHPQPWWTQADGLHLRSQDAARWQDKFTADVATRNGWLSMSTHTQNDIQLARQLNTDFIVLGHVLDTPSHPAEAAMGWDRFEQLQQQAACPVFAIGGQSSHTLATAQKHGAHGIAGIRHLLSPS